jgi:hypothetical protein
MKSTIVPANKECRGGRAVRCWVRGGRRPQRRAPRKSDYIFFSEHLFAVSSHIPPALSQLAWSVDLAISPAASEPGGEELCSWAPGEVSPPVPAVDLPDMSFAASDSGGAELCSFAPVEVSGPPAAGFWASSAAKVALAHMNAATAAIANLRVMGGFLVKWFD